MNYPAENKPTVIICLPSFNDEGGVSSFYNSTLPFLNARYTIIPMEIGSTAGSGRPFHRLSDQLRFLTLLKAENPDLVHVNPSLNLKSILRDGLFIWWALKAKRPVLVFFHGWDRSFESFFSGKRMRLLFIKTFGKADHIITLCRDFSNTLRKWGWAGPVSELTTTVDNSLLSQFSLKRRLKELSTTPLIRVLFLARLEHEKGIFETIEAISILIRKGIGVSLSIAGDGPAKEMVRKHVSRLGLPDDRIRLIGYVRNEEKSAAFFSHHLYCLPTYYGEGLPTSVLEAMACGMPVVTRSVGGIADFFIHGKMGMLCNGKAPEEIASAIETIISDRKRMAELSAFNYHYAQTHFMASTVSDRLADIYNSIIKG